MLKYVSTWSSIKDKLYSADNVSTSLIFHFVLVKKNIWGGSFFPGGDWGGGGGEGHA